MKSNVFIRLLAAVSLFAIGLGFYRPPAARAQAVEYSGKSRVLNVGKLIVDSGTYQSPALQGVPEDTAPYIFYLMDLRKDLKPRGWELQNPLAPPTVTPKIRARWIQIDPTVAHSLRYAVGSPITKDMAAYWEVSLSDTPISDLLKFDLLFISSHTPGEVFTPQEQEKMRKLVEAGGVVWLDDCWKFRISDTGRFFLPNLQFHGSAIGKANPVSYALIADRSHPLISSPYFLTQDELNHLGDKNVGGYYQTGFVPPGAVNVNPPFTDTTPPAASDLSQPEPDVLAPVIFNSWTAANVKGGPYPYVSAGQYGAGYVICTSGDVGDAINANCTGTTGYNIPAPDYDKNGGSVCGNAVNASDPEDLKFAYNALSWASNFSTYRRGPEHSAYAPQSVTVPLSRQWQFPLGAGEAIESDPILLRGDVFATTTAGRLICLLQDPTQVLGATGPIVRWQAQPTQAPLSSITTAEVGQAPNAKTGAGPHSLQLLLVAGGGQVFAYNAAFDPTQPVSLNNPQLVWTFPANGQLPAPDGTADKIAGAPVFMDGSVYVTTVSGAVWEINPADGTPSRSLLMPTDPNNAATDPTLPATEPSLHYSDPTSWNYIAASPTAGYVVDRATSSDDPTLVLCVYSSATQINTAPNPPKGGLLQFPIRVSNEHLTLAEGLAPDKNGSTRLTLQYRVLKNPELVSVALTNGKLVTTPVKTTINGGPAGSGSARATIQWPDGTLAPVFYDTDGNGAMAADYDGSTAITPGHWRFVKPVQKPLTWNNNGTASTRGQYTQIALAALQYRVDANGNYSLQPVTPDCVVHMDYDVDQEDPTGAAGTTNGGPAFHPDLAALKLETPDNTPAGSAALGPPSIGLDDSVYFGNENGVLYSVSHYGRIGLAVNWKYDVNPLTWTTSAGAPINPVTLADASNNFTNDIQTTPGASVIRTAPTVGNGRVFVTVTDLNTNQSRVMAFNTLEFQQTNASVASTNGTAPSTQLGGIPVTLHLKGPDPNDPNAFSNLRNTVDPVSEVGQFDPLTNKWVFLLPARHDVEVDPDAQTVTITQFGRLYANLPIFIWYNLANGQRHIYQSNPPTPPDEVHNVVPGVNGLPYDASQKYLFPNPTGAYMGGSTSYSGGTPTPPQGQSWPHPYYFYPGEQVGNLIWQFPDPVWNTGDKNWNQPVFPTLDVSSTTWSGPMGAGGPLVQPFAGTTIGAPPAPSIADASPVLVGDTILLGVSKLTTPFSQPAEAITTGLMALDADPRDGLVGYTDPDNVGIYKYGAIQQHPGGSFPPGFAVNDPNNVVSSVNTLMSNAGATLVAPYPPNVTFYTDRDFQGEAGMISTPAAAGDGVVVGAGTGGSGNTGTLTMLGSPTTIALDSYRLVGLDTGGNVSYEIPSTTKLTFLGSDAPPEETDVAPNPGLYHTTQVPFNRPSSMQRVDNTNVLIADTGSNRVVETDLGGNVVSEITRYFDPSKPYQPGDVYLVAPGDPANNVPDAYSIGNVRLTSPTDAYQWSDITADQTGNNILNTYRLIVDAGNFQVVEIQDSIYLTGTNAGQYVVVPAPLPPTISGPTGAPVSLRLYHLKVWGSLTPPSGAQYRYRNAVPFLTQVTDQYGQHQYMSYVLATVGNYALTPVAGPNNTTVWKEQPGASIVVLYGPTTAAGAPLPPAIAGTIKSSVTSFNDLRTDAGPTPLPGPGSNHPLQNPVFLRQYFGVDPANPGGALWHLLYIDQGAFYTPAGQDTRVGNWGAYDLVIGGPIPPNAIPNAPNLLPASFTPNAVGSLDDLDYAQLTDQFTNPYSDLFYVGPPGFALPAYEPTSLEYQPLTNTVLLSNGALNQLADPTRLPPQYVLNDPRRFLGPGGEVLLLDGNSFYHSPVNGTGSPSYRPDNSANPSILFRSIPVEGSYLLQQVVAADRR